MIDEIGRKIMIALGKDGRYSYAKLAKELGIKATTVARRVEIMVNDDVFSISAVPNPISLGYVVMAVICLDIELPQVDNVCAKLVNNPNISSISTTFGRFDVVLFAEYRSLDMLYRLVKEEIPALDGVKTVETLIIRELKKRYQGVFNKDSHLNKPFAVDEIDEEIIKALRKNGRTAFTALAQKLGVSPAMISRRVASLVKNNVIEITIVPNPSKLGRTIVAYVGLKVKLNKLDNVISQLSGFQQIPSMTTLLNGYDVLAVVTAPNLESLYGFIMQEIAFIDGVTNAETLIRGEFKKRTYLGFDLKEKLHQLS
jgi:Lrp/AsnC family transcriptional regulator, regulator for asnA, asnC and gidA